MLLSLSGCKWVITKEKEPLSPKEPNQMNGLNTMINPGTTTAEGFHYRVFNGSKWEVMYGEPYYIQKKNNEDWEDLMPKEDMVFTDIGHTIKPTFYKEESIDWSYHYGSLEKGSYRFCKVMTIEEPVSQQFDICTYFEIK